MYDYVLQYGFSKEIQNNIQEIRNYLKENNIKDTERAWLPHITIDLYNCKNREKFIEDNKLCDKEITITKGRLGKPYFFIKDPNGILMEIIEED